jgi:hypothetical protein
MRQKTTTKKETKTIKPKQVSVKVQAIENYFKDVPTIKMSLVALSELQSSVGWQILVAYLKATKDNILKELQIIDTNEPNVLNRINQLQSELKVIDYLMSLPNIIIESYNNDFGGEILDPYSQS